MWQEMLSDDLLPIYNITQADTGRGQEKQIHQVGSQKQKTY